MLTLGQLRILLGEIRSRRLRPAASPDDLRLALIDGTQALKLALSSGAADRRSLMEIVKDHPVLSESERLRNAIRRRNKLASHRTSESLLADPLGTHSVSREDAAEFFDAVDAELANHPDYTTESLDECTLGTLFELIAGNPAGFLHLCRREPWLPVALGGAAILAVVAKAPEEERRRLAALFGLVVIGGVLAAADSSAGRTKQKPSVRAGEANADASMDQPASSPSATLSSMRTAVQSAKASSEELARSGLEGFVGCLRFATLVSALMVALAFLSALVARC